MSTVVDTPHVLWSLVKRLLLDARARRVLGDLDTPKYVSTVNLWEIALKCSIGKLTLTGTTPEGLLRTALESGFELLELSAEDAATSHLLPFTGGHRDPFDRLLVWQCMRNGLAMLSSDRAMRTYQQHGLKLAR